MSQSRRFRENVYSIVSVQDTQSWFDKRHNRIHSPLSPKRDVHSLLPEPPSRLDPWKVFQVSRNPSPVLTGESRQHLTRRDVPGVGPRTNFRRVQSQSRARDGRSVWANRGEPFGATRVRPRGSRSRVGSSENRREGGDGPGGVVPTHSKDSTFRLIRHGGNRFWDTTDPKHDFGGVVGPKRLPGKSSTSRLRVK